MAEFQIKNNVFTAKKSEPGLYIAATPIGNLGDITLRALETLAGCDLIACEDTRVTGKLLRHFGISTKTVPYHEHNADKMGPKLISELDAGKSITLVSDAGTPLISDPGYRLVLAAREQGLPITPLPGASAPLAALVASGFETSAFTFVGFLPSKQGARITALEAYDTVKNTLIFFESPNRLAKTLGDMTTAFGTNRRAVVARELTKLHEEFISGTLEELFLRFESELTKGEIVIILEPIKGDGEINVDQLLGELLERMSVSKAAAEAVELTGLSKRDLYQRALTLKENG